MELFRSVGQDYRIQEGMLRLPERKNSREFLGALTLTGGRENTAIRAWLKGGAFRWIDS